MLRSAPSGLKSGATLVQDGSITKEREFCSNLTRSRLASEFKSAVRSTIRNWSTGTAFVRHHTRRCVHHGRRRYAVSIQAKTRTSHARAPVTKRPTELQRCRRRYTAPVAAAIATKAVIIDRAGPGPCPLNDPIQTHPVAVNTKAVAAAASIALPRLTARSSAATTTTARIASDARY